MTELPITTILALSGGLDSAYTLWQWMENRANDNQRILIHHVNLLHKDENRLVREKEAVDNILYYFAANGHNNFVYHESDFNYGDFPRITIKDIQIVSMFTAILLKTKQYQSVNHLILSWHKGEVNSDEIRRGYRVKSMFKALDLTRHISFHFPIEFMTRRQMIETIPEELLSYVHSCRMPTREIKACGECKTCKEYLEENLKPI